MRSFSVLALASVVAAQAEHQYTATQTASVAAAAATAKTSSPTSNVGGKAFDRFVTIWLENTDYDKAAGDPNLAWLATKGITLSNKFAVTHPSEPNYCAAIGGDYFGMDNDNFNEVPSNISSIVDLLEAKGISWGHYQEDMPYSGFEGFSWVNQQTGANDYVRKHNPAILYDSVTSSTQRLSQIKNLTMFFSDLKADKLPQWMFITPNMTSDGHDTTVTQAGTWTRNFLEPLLNDKNFMKNTLVLVTFDENHTYTNQNKILGILLGDAVPSQYVGTTDDSYYNHYSEIATVEANWGLDTLGRFDVGANVYKMVAEKTNDLVRAWDGNNTFSSMFFNTSYAGLFNSKVTAVPIPRPNLNAVSPRNGRKVSSVVKKYWQRGLPMSNDDTYYKADKDNVMYVNIPDGMHYPAGYKAQ